MERIDNKIRVVQVAIALAPAEADNELAEDLPLLATAGYRDSPRPVPVVERPWVTPRVLHAARALASAAGVVALLAATTASCTNAVIPSPATPGYACGVMGISCGNGMCCDRDQTCGIPHTASEGMCRFNGEGMMAGGKATGGGPAMTRQWAPRAP